MADDRYGSRRAAFLHSHREELAGHSAEISARPAGDGQDFDQ
jgi:hypothetical protein